MFLENRTDLFRMSRFCTFSAFLQKSAGLLQEEMYCNHLKYKSRVYESEIVLKHTQCIIIFLRL